MIEQANLNSPLGENPISVRPADIDGPGRLRDEVWLTVQSHHARRVILGRTGTQEKPAITGLLGFADRLRIIWNAARADDPYADWWLMKIDDALECAQRRIRTEQAALDDCIEKCATLQIKVATTEKPYRIELQFATPYAYSAAQLVAEFDAAARSVLTVKHVGLMNGALAECALGRCAAAIRSLFAVPQGFRVLRIDRQAVRAGSKAAKAAADLMGELPQAVLLGEHAAVLTPRQAQP